MPDLFESEQGQRIAEGRSPLAERLRPRRLEDVVGQNHILAADAPLGLMLASRSLTSLIFWGPPGVGKTTVARLLAFESGHVFIEKNAVSTSIQDLRRLFEEARFRSSMGQGTLVFIDEIHRLNTTLQDSFLPYMEDGSLVLVGATTENPSFELNSALLSRAQVMILKRLGHEDLTLVLRRAEVLARRDLPLDNSARDRLVELADGDARILLNMVEQILAWPVKGILDAEALANRLMRRAAKYDKSGDEHFNLVSALHKSVRGSDPDAALYWLARMLTAGEDPRFLARRITRMAVEDIGLADPEAQDVCLRAWESYERLGSPEGELALGQAVVYLALAPKSNSIYMAFLASMDMARQRESEPPPRHILNAPTRLMKEQGFGQGYKYDHDAEDCFSGQNYFPEGMKRPVFFLPTDRGFERELKKRLQYFVDLRRLREAKESSDCHDSGSIR